MRKVYLSLILALIFVWSGCASMKVTHNYDESADFKSIKKFAWHKSTNEYVEKLEMDKNIDTYIRNSVENELRKSGYEKTDESTADFLLLYSAVVDVKVDTDSKARYYDYPVSWNWDMDAGRLTDHVYDEGTLVLDFIGHESGEPFWRGTAKAQLDRSNIFDKKAKKINRAVKKIIKKFPPAK